MTKRRVFYSFDYKEDNWRTMTVRNIGATEDDRLATPNEWEAVKRSGDMAVKRWIADQINGRSCTVVLVGTKTADRKWINYEISESWNDGMGVVGIYIHGLKDSDGGISAKGKNPFDFIDYGQTGKKLSSIVKCYDPLEPNSQGCYNWIRTHLAAAIEEAIQIRMNN